MFSQILHVRTSGLNFSSGFAVCSRSSSHGLIGSIVGRVKLSSGACEPGMITSRVSGTGGQLVLPRTCLSSHRVRHTSRTSHVPLAKRVCAHCTRQYHRTGIVSFSSLLLCACLLFGGRPSMYHCCTGGFRCILMSRCRSAGCTRRYVI